MTKKTEMTFGRLHHCTFAEALELWNRGFEDYFTDMTISMERLLSHMTNNSIRPELSIVAYVEGRLAGFVFLGVKTADGVKRAWNGGTGVFPEYRGQGIAKRMMREARRTLREEQVEEAVLEVVSVNAHAIAAYESVGFQIADRVAGWTRDGVFEKPFPGGSLPAGFRLQQGTPAEVRGLAFYRNHAAWECQWHNIRGGASCIIRDESGQAAAYALFKRVEDDEGVLKSIVLYQCEVGPLGLSVASDLYRILLGEVFGPFDTPCVRSSANLSAASPVLQDLLTEYGFTVKYEQYVMICHPFEGEGEA